MGGIRRVLVFSALLSALLVSSFQGSEPALAAAPPAPGFDPRGYWTVRTDGAVESFDGPSPGTPGQGLNAPVVGAATTPSGRGLWLAAADGGVFTAHAAPFIGSAGALRLNSPIVGIGSGGSGSGYWLVARDGGVFSYGDAAFYGSTGAQRLNAPIVGMSAMPGGGGYRLVASDGGIFDFGNATFHGSTGWMRLNSPIVGMASTPSGSGYWLVARDGGVFSFGDARFFGSTGAMRLNVPITGMAGTPSGRGYWLVAGDGGVFTFGDATFAGSAAGRSTGGGTVSVVGAPRPHSAEVSIFYYPWYATPSVDAEYRHWDQGGHVPPDDIGANYYPLRGAYSSSDLPVISAQMEEIRAAGINTVVSSWWGRNSFEDSVLPKVLAAAHLRGLRVAAHIEPYGGRTAETLAADYTYLLNLGVDEFYVYLADTMEASPLAAANETLPSTVRVFAESGNVTGMRNGSFAAWAAGARFTGIYTYDAYSYGAGDFGKICGAAHREGILCAPSAAPGWDATRATPNPKIRDRAGGLTYDLLWAGAIAAAADVVSVTSYNEWHEGTQIEPAVPFCTAAPTFFCYSTYTGSYGAPGDARNAYLDRTRYWAARYAEQVAG